MSKTKTETFARVWDALADTAEERANLRVRSDLVGKLSEIIDQNGWTQAQAAARCGVTQPRINDLLRGRLSRFSLDALVNIAAAVGRQVRIEIRPARHAQRSNAVHKRSDIKRSAKDPARNARVQRRVKGEISGLRAAAKLRSDGGR
jgi:predicted XRE-type DNA-binding protein